MEKIKTPEEILENNYKNYKKRIAFEENVIAAMEEYGKQRHNQAIKSAAEHAEKLENDGFVVDKNSILKLLEP